ncbi:MAG: DUF2752 domain-containing protein [Chthoniobacteraceae bacterium]
MTARAASQSSALIGPLLESRTMCACIAGAAAVHFATIATGLVGWPCPVRHAFGIPCPGCGLGRAGALLLRGQVAASLHVHAFAGPAIVAIGLFAVATFLPNALRHRLARAIASLELRVPLVPAFLGALLLYWLLRLVLDARGFVQLTT